ncbi:MAG: DUF4240 domain-containing protein [Sandaracinaceae bacterium]|nr:DUF4240 domain-containing protein [Sandaracinaceae bacterium]
MDEAKFWKLVEASRARCKSTSADPSDQQDAILVELLAELPAKEIVEFDRIFRRLHAVAYTWDLWAAAYIIEGGCSDDAFIDFRSGLIGLGRKVYEDAVRDPGTLVSQPARGVNLSNEQMMYAAMEAYENLVGDELPVDELTQPAEPAGEPWDEESVDEKYPALARKFAAG